MEKRVVIFLVISLAVILGYDLLLKQLGLLPPSPTVQETANQESGGPKREAGPTSEEKTLDQAPSSGPRSTSPSPGWFDSLGTSSRPYGHD
jgi:YidC/Oxa1 family membrane protein insertase